MDVMYFRWHSSFITSGTRGKQQVTPSRAAPHPIRKHDVRATLSTKIFVRAARSWIPMDVTPIGHGAFPMASSTYSSFACSKASVVPFS